MKFYVKTNNFELENRFWFTFKSIESINLGHWKNNMSSGLIGLAPF